MVAPASPPLDLLSQITKTCLRGEKFTQKLHAILEGIRENSSNSRQFAFQSEIQQSRASWRALRAAALEPASRLRVQGIRQPLTGRYQRLLLRTLVAERTGLSGRSPMRGVAAASPPLVCVRSAPGRANPLRGFESRACVQLDEGVTKGRFCVLWWRSGRDYRACSPMRGVAAASPPLVCVRFAPGRANPLRGFESRACVQLDEGVTKGRFCVLWWRSGRDSNPRPPA